MADVPQDISVSEYFEKVVPEIFKEQIESTTVLGMEGTKASLMFNVAGDAGVQTYSLVITNAKDLEIVAGPVDDPLVTLDLDEATWRDAVTGKLAGAMDMFTDASQLANRSRYDKILDIKGTLVLDLSRPDGDNVAVKVVFNGAESPSATFRCSLEDWVAIGKGELAGTTAFMGGKLKIEGDMPLAIQLSTLTV
jgi:putative sterol carrier protein